MLDVHPPHESVHSWRDFFIHIATIVIGLLIAIALEQTVEAIHHHHQRHQLEGQLRAEARQNQIYVQREIQLTEAYFDWAIRSVAEAKAAGSTGPLSLRRFPPIDMWIPDTGLWRSAKDNGTVALLSSGEQVWYTDLYRMEADCFASSTGAYDRLRASLSQLDNLVVLSGATANADSIIDLSGLPVDQRITAAHLLAQVAVAARDLDYELLDYDSANRYLLETPPALWSDQAGISIYTRIYLQNFAKHPKSRYTFNSKQTDTTP